ncbi:MAG: NADH-quinone oxidoreductase subunit A [Fibrobacteria bacterium]|nr:NADH-quinone oxidoreductase subunit A [Fibrobacteria bacterium]
MGLNLAVIFGFFIVSASIFFAILLFGKFIRPSNPQTVKNSTYECGEKPTGLAWFNFNNRFYIIALIFVIFDVEVALLLPVIVVYRKMVNSGMGLLAFSEIFFFMGVLFVALIYFWAKGDLNWDKVVRKIKLSQKEVV